MSLPVASRDVQSISQQTNRLSMFQLTDRIIGAAIKIHRRLGPGLLECAYETCLAYELKTQGLRVIQQKGVPLIYEGVKLECGFRADLLVENRVVVELKCKDQIHPVDEAQLLSHLRLLGLQVGLLINVHVVLLRDGIRRMVNDYREEQTAEIAGELPQRSLRKFAPCRGHVARRVSGCALLGDRPRLVRLCPKKLRVLCGSSLRPLRFKIFEPQPRPPRSARPATTVRIR
jgi:GxxExxY protein